MRWRTVATVVAVVVIVVVPSMESFKVDLAAAGIPEYEKQGRRVDFHALLYTLGTNSVNHAWRLGWRWRRCRTAT